MRSCSDADVQQGASWPLLPLLFLLLLKLLLLLLLLLLRLLLILVLLLVLLLLLLPVSWLLFFRMLLLPLRLLSERLFHRRRPFHLHLLSSLFRLLPLLHLMWQLPRPPRPCCRTAVVSSNAMAICSAAGSMACLVRSRGTSRGGAFLASPLCLHCLIATLFCCPAMCGSMCCLVPRPLPSALLPLLRRHWRQQRLLGFSCHSNLCVGSA
jgi:hypothetical protein